MQFAWIGLVAGLATGSMLGETAWWSLAGFILGFYLDQRRQWQSVQRQIEQLRQQLTLPTSSTQQLQTTTTPHSTLNNNSNNNSNNGTSGINTSDNDTSAAPQQTNPLYQADAPLAEPPATPLHSPPDSAWQTGPDVALPDYLAPLRTLWQQSNPLVLAGLAVLFLGLSFLATYFAHQGLLSMPVRLSAIGLAGAALIVTGWRQRRRGSYAMLLQGGGLAVIYLTLYASCKYYPVLTTSTAFGAMLLLVLAGCALAFRQQSQQLAVLASAGGFLAPLLTSDGSNQFVALFSYYLALNLGIALLATQRQWRLLNWTGFAATFVIMLGWQISYYHSSDYWLVQPFLLAYFLLYLLISYWFSRQQPPQLTNLLDGSLVFGLPLLAFTQQLQLTEHLTHGDSLSALGFALIYGALYWHCRRQALPQLQLYQQLQLVFAMLFSALIVPFYFGASWTAMGWALQGAALYWLGCRQHSLLNKAVAWLLTAGAICTLEQQHWQAGVPYPFLSAGFSNTLTLALALLFMPLAAQGWQRQQAAQQTPVGWPAYERYLLALSFALGFWYSHQALLLEVMPLVDAPRLPWQNLLLGVLALIALWLARRPALRGLHSWGYGILPMTLWTNLLLFSYIGMLRTDWLAHEPSLALGLLEVLFQSYIWALPGLLLPAYCHYRWLGADRQYLPYYLAGMPWLLGVALLFEALWWPQHWQLPADVALGWYAFMLLPALLLLDQLQQPASRRPSWLAAQWFPAWLQWPFLAAAAYLWLLTMVSPASSAQLWPPLPLLNIPDLVLLSCLWLLWRGNRHLPWPAPSFSQQQAVQWLLLFVSANVLLCRAIALSTDLNWTLAALWHSSDIQLALAISWTCLALPVMLRAHQRQQRQPWLWGAILLAVVLAKLLLVDLADSDSLHRILSFIVVGVLTIVVGIKAPLPPRRIAPAADTSTADNDASTGSSTTANATSGANTGGSV